MRPLTPSEKRTLRFGAICITAYLVLFGGFQGWRALSKHRAEYNRLQAEAQTVKEQVQVYDDRVAIIKKLMEGFKMDPAKLSRASVVAQASAAIQNVAKTSGVQVGAVREGVGRAANKELASIQLEAMGPIPGLLKFLHELESTGFPLFIDAMQLGSEAARPGPVKMSLTIVILDFEQWKKQEARNAAA